MYIVMAFCPVCRKRIAMVMVSANLLDTVMDGLSRRSDVGTVMAIGVR